MSIYEAMQDELTKISALRCRSGSMPIRAHNLADKTTYDKSTKLIAKLAAARVATQKILASPAAKNLAIAAGGALAYDTTRTGYQDWKLGRAVRKQQGG
jgi:hypothetical protein